VILEHSVLGLHYLSSPCTPSLLSCNPLSRALQYILLSYNPLSRALYLDSFLVCITSTSIPASLRCTCFDIARQILSTLLSTFRANPHRPRRTLRPTDRNSSEIHATPVNDRDDAHPELTNKSLQMLKPGYQDRIAVEDALGHVGDRSLGAKVTRWNALKKKTKHIQDQIWEREDQLFALSIDQQACRSRLEEARVINRLQDKMHRDRQVYPLTPWSVEHGCST
jgi:hypothetical protein